VKANVLGQDFGLTLMKMIESKKSKSKIACRVKLYYDLRILEKKLLSYGIKEPTKTKSYTSLLEYVEICEMFLNANSTVEKAIADIKNVFSDSIEQITLSTIHRAKGREADNVFIIHRELMPSKMAVESWELEQEQNLMYVAYTRAKHVLTFVTDFDYIAELEELEKNRATKNKKDDD
jgi:superfamily I DNA/RNA helicase